MGLIRGIPPPTLVVPDEETCLVFGRDPGDWVATDEPGRARLLLLPERVPEGLVAAVQAAWSLMPADRTARTYELALPGVGAQEVLDGDGHEGHVHDAES
ncbi:MAG TPA: hypothetical protein VG474_13085, partial [Solirubrobacteraceae bacterium]|nr:hypothetical protein [Solirubrobacteraceae bacterium]